MNRLSFFKSTHDLAHLLGVKNSFYAREVLRFMKESIENDLFSYARSKSRVRLSRKKFSRQGKHLSGDITSKLLGLGEKRIRARIVAKSSGILAGVQEISFFLGKIHSPIGKIQCTFLKKDGASVHKGHTIAIFHGKAADIFALERTMLNLLQRMSGIATFTAKFVQKVPSSVLVTPTRKTFWGLFDKRACCVGGAGTHRLHLSDAVLIKDTHLDTLQSDFRQILQKIFRAGIQKKRARFIEIELEKPKDALEVARLYHQLYKKQKKTSLFIMLDNMKPERIATVIKKIRDTYSALPIFFEASGGINLKNIQSYSKTGAHILSIGALTHSAPALDFSLKVIKS